MTATQSGMAVAAVLTIVWIVLGFTPFVLTAIAIVIGALIGRFIEGTLDVQGIVNAVRGRRSSS